MQAAEKILVVDDEPQVLVALEDLLSEGFMIFKAGSAEQARAIVDKEQDIAVVVTERAVGAPAPVRCSRRRRTFFKRPVTVIAKEEIGAIRSDVEILITVIVIVRHADTGGPAFLVQMCLRRAVPEAAVHILV